MKIAIHNRPDSFSDRWITYCEENKVDYKLVNCFDTDIISQVGDCQGLMWHWSHEDYKASLSARQLTLALEKKGIKVYPDVDTSWHFDDKVGQKYLLEAIDAPFVKSYIFYSKKEALKWVNDTTFPKVFKLRGGAGSINVSLVNTKQKAKQLVRRSFHNGFSSSNSISRFKDRFWVLKRDKNFKAVKGVVNGFGHLFIPREVDRISFTQKGYVYFQDFIPKNEFDTRLVVIGNRCIGIRRYCREGDFRASGSGVVKYEPSLFDEKLIRIAFETAGKLKVQSIAMDFIMDGKEPKIVEISYAFSMGKSYDNCPGFWDSNLNWHNETVNPQYFIIQDFIEDLKKNTNLI